MPKKERTVIVRLQLILQFIEIPRQERDQC